jgi:carbon-monoxide dehydrogenase medium subunit
VRNFEFLEPTSPVEASRMLVDSGENSRLFAGGTALLLAMRQRMLSPSHLVYIGGVPDLDRIDYDERNGLRIGALVRHGELADAPVVIARYPILAAMAVHVANPQIRNMGTLGGNLCYADPATDPPTCLLALEARVKAVGTRGERVIAIDEFFTDYYETALQPDEVVTEIQVPPLSSDAVGAYTRFLRTPAEHRPLVGLAAVARRDRGVCAEARIAIGASTPVPTRARRAEEFLAGKRITPDIVDEAARIAAADIFLVSDSRGAAEYRRDMVRVVTRRTLASVLGLTAAEAAS